MIEKNYKLRQIAQRNDKILHKKNIPPPEQPENPEPCTETPSDQQLFAFDQDHEPSFQTVYYRPPDFNFNMQGFYESTRRSGCGDYSLVFHQPEILLHQENDEVTAQSQSIDQFSQQYSRAEHFDWAAETVDFNQDTISTIKQETNQHSEVDESEYNLGPSISTNSINLPEYQSMRSWRSKSTIPRSSSDEDFEEIFYSDDEPADCFEIPDSEADEPEDFFEKPDSDDDVAYLICFNCTVSQHFRRY